jgi:M-phase inducer tyrosine phosphatase
MFQNPAELLTEELNEEKEVMQMSSSPQCAFDLNTSPCDQGVLARPDCTLKTFSVKEDPFLRIGRETLCEILDGQYSNLYDRHIIVDCRFEYEYIGGHIDGAININSKQRLESELKGDLSKRTEDEKVLLIFHCEYSAHRGPRMAMHLRNCDRQLNMHNYPKLSYPDIVILQGGYNHFFEQFFARCVPQKYVEMTASEHRKTCERELGRFRRNMKAHRTQSCLNFGGSGSCTTQGQCQIPEEVTPQQGTPTGGLARNFLFPLRERDPNLTGTPTGPPSRKLARIQSEKITAQLRF